jgi:hypothetical protein
VAASVMAGRCGPALALRPTFGSVPDSDVSIRSNVREQRTENREQRTENREQKTDYSITSSARASRVGGTAMRSDRAVRRFIDSVRRVGSWNGVVGREGRSRRSLTARLDNIALVECGVPFACSCRTQGKQVHRASVVRMPGLELIGVPLSSSSSLPSIMLAN